MKNKIKEVFSDMLFCGGGSLVYSAAVRVFAEGNDIAQGGVTGIAMLVNFMFPRVPIGIAVLVLNLPLFALAWKFIGGKFILKSFLVTIFLSISIDAFSFLPMYTGDKLLASIFCGALSGLGMAMIFMRGLTSGGTDILAKLIMLKKPQMSMGRLILISDFFVVILAGIVYGNFESAMYSVILFFVSSFVIDKILFGLTDSRTLIIISDSPQKIAIEIMLGFGRGVNLLPSEGGYTGKSRKIILSALRRSQVAKAHKAILEIDENAFIIVLPSSEIVGRGFLENP